MNEFLNVLTPGNYTIKRLKCFSMGLYCLRCKIACFRTLIFRLYVSFPFLEDIIEFEARVNNLTNFTLLSFVTSFVFTLTGAQLH